MSSKAKVSPAKSKSVVNGHSVVGGEDLPPELVSELRGARDRSADYDVVVDVMQGKGTLSLNDILIGVYRGHGKILKRSQLIGVMAGLKRANRVVKEGGNYRLSHSESAQAN